MNIIRWSVLLIAILFGTVAAAAMKNYYLSFGSYYQYLNNNDSQLLDNAAGVGLSVGFVFKHKRDLHSEIVVGRLNSEQNKRVRQRYSVFHYGYTLKRRFRLLRSFKPYVFLGIDFSTISLTQRQVTATRHPLSDRSVSFQYIVFGVSNQHDLSNNWKISYFADTRNDFFSAKGGTKINIGFNVMWGI